MEIHYCERCGTRVAKNDIDSGAAEQQDNKLYFCSGCTSEARKERLDLAPAEDEPGGRSVRIFPRSNSSSVCAFSAVFTVSGIRHLSRAQPAVR